MSVPALLKKYGLRPSKGLGQNFLVDENALRKIVNAADIRESDIILEIGPGLGSLTRHLAAVARQVVAVELDDRLLPALHETLAPFDNVKIIVGDILNLDMAHLMGNGAEMRSQPYKVVANIPYYITSALIRRLLEVEIQLKSIVFTMQKEMAMRIAARPPNMSLLALSVQVYGEPKIAAKIPAGAFYPPPKVDSAVLRVDLRPTPLISAPLLPTFFRLAKAGFSQKRKTLRNAIAAGMHWEKSQAEAVLSAAKIDPQRRAQTLSIDEWDALTNASRSQG